MYEDKTLICKECGKEFVFTAGEQEFYASKGFVNEPQRCKACRDARKNAAKGERECILLCAPPAAGRPGFPSSRARIARCIAASALPRCAAKRNNYDSVTSAPRAEKLRAGVFAFCDAPVLQKHDLGIIMGKRNCLKRRKYWRYPSDGCYYERHPHRRHPEY